MRRGWGLSQYGLNFLVVWIAAFIWIAAITHAVKKVWRDIREERELSRIERELWE